VGHILQQFSVSKNNAQIGKICMKKWNTQDKTGQIAIFRLFRHKKFPIRELPEKYVDRDKIWRYSFINER
jgi:hypothetical protein